MKTLFDYLANEYGDGKTEFRVVIQARARHQDGPIIFYIHPFGKDGESADFAVCRDDRIRYATGDDA